jgi:hypothetical protein
MEHVNSKFARALPMAAITALLLASSPLMAEKVYRWVDEDGNVHYTESLPPDYKDTGHDVLNEQGLVVDENQRLTPAAEEERKSEEQAKAEEANELPRDSSGLPRPKPLYTEDQKRARMDNFLMLRYDSEQEIVDAMDVEIRQLNYDRDLIEGSLASVNEAYRGHIKIAAERQRAGQALQSGVEEQVADLRVKLSQNQRELAALEQREEKIRADFQAQLERYRYLREKYAEQESG